MQHYIDIKFRMGRQCYKRDFALFLVIVIENHNFNINNIFDIKTTAIDLQAISDGKNIGNKKK